MTSSNARAIPIVLACGLAAACATGGVTRPDLPQEERGHRSFILPAIEILAMDAAVNLGGRQLLEPTDFDVTTASIRRNLRRRWVIDDDSFEINQFLHPYQGAMYHGITRSNGLSYWPSAAYTFVSSALWEIAGETTPPSRNDQIASGIAGSFLGEPLYRISRLLLKRADDGPGVWRRLGSILASPPVGINDALLGDPSESLAPDDVPFSDIRMQFGAVANVTGRTRSVSSLTLNRAQLALSMDYGYPGRVGYRHERPFDYFRIDSRVSAEGLDQLSTRGLLAGADYGAGRLNGIWGLYGTYDYFAPDEFHFSSTAFSVGTTLQASLSESFVVQSSGLVGAGYAAAHSGIGESNGTDGRNSHYGVTPQALANLRLIAGRRAAVDLIGREYYVSTIGGFGTGQRDLLIVGDASLALRVYGRHAVGLTYQLAGRSSDYLTLPDQRQARSTVGVFYTFLGAGGFGAVR